MNIDLRFPNINAPTTEGQMTQMKSYMHQFVQQLNWALNTVNEAASGNTSSVVMSNKKLESLSPEEAENTFNSIKSLIIKSADIVKAYEETIFTDFNGKYFAESDFGTYIAETNRKVDENSERTLDTFTKVERITNAAGTGSLDVVREDVRITEAYIKKGNLGDHDRLGNNIYGMAVGQYEKIDEQTEFTGEKNYAWFTAYGVSLFDENNNEVAYISQNKLYITDAAFSGAVQFGGYKADTSDGLAFTWIGW